MAAKNPMPLPSQPTYAIAELFPRQGQWTEDEFLALETNRLIELSDGNLEVLEMPSDFHQLVLGRLFAWVFAFVTQHDLGHVRFAPLRVRLWPGKFREPDLIFLSAAHADRIHEKYWDAPDLAVEIVSPDDPDRDALVKQAEYARAGIPEYWLVNPESRTIEVYVLPPGAQEYRLGQTLGMADALTSALFPGLELSVAALFAEK